MNGHVISNKDFSFDSIVFPAFYIIKDFVGHSVKNSVFFILVEFDFLLTSEK